MATKIDSTFYSETVSPYSLNMLSIKRTKTRSTISIASSSSHHYQTPSSAETTANIDDLLTEILLRLPVKALLKFKYVSKHWLSLISNPIFSHRQSLVRKPITGLFVHRFTLLANNPEYDFINLDSIPSRTPFKSLTFDNDSYGIKVLQSCNGLLLCSSFRAYEPHRSYYVYNPITKQCTVLPRFRVGRGVFRSTFGVNLAFNPSKSPHYKVICVRNCDSSRDGHCQIEIYSSKTGPWRLSGGSSTAPIDTNFKGGVFWNGAIHWISPYGTSLYFTVDEEKVREMPMPPIPDGWDKRRYQYFGESGGRLHLIEVYGPCTALFNVYEMERDYSGWFVKYRVDLTCIAAAFPDMIRTYLDPEDLLYYGYSILCVVREENDEDSYLVLHLPKKAVRYNLKDKTFKKLCDFAPADNQAEDESALQFRWFDAFQYSESLACV